MSGELDLPADLGLDAVQKSECTGTYDQAPRRYGA